MYTAFASVLCEIILYLCYNTLLNIECLLNLLHDLLMISQEIILDLIQWIITVFWLLRVLCLSHNKYSCRAWYITQPFTRQAPAVHCRFAWRKTLFTAWQYKHANPYKPFQSKDHEAQWMILACINPVVKRGKMPISRSNSSSEI